MHHPSKLPYQPMIDLNTIPPVTAMILHPNQVYSFLQTEVEILSYPTPNRDNEEMNLKKWRRTFNSVGREGREPFTHRGDTIPEAIPTIPYPSHTQLPDSPANVNTKIQQGDKGLLSRNPSRLSINHSDPCHISKSNEFKPIYD